MSKQMLLRYLRSLEGAEKWTDAGLLYMWRMCLSLGGSVRDAIEHPGQAVQGNKES